VVRSELGDHAGGLDDLERALAIDERAGGQHRNQVLLDLGQVLAHAGQLAAARARFVEARGAIAATLGEAHPLHAAAEGYLAALDLETDPAAAAAALGRAVARTAAALGDAHPQTARARATLANALIEALRLDEARAALEAARPVLEAALGADHADVLRIAHATARIDSYQGRFAEAEAGFEIAIAGFERALGAEHPDLVAPLTGLAGAHNERGAYDRALPLVERAVAIADAQPAGVIGPRQRATTDLAHAIALAGTGATARGVALARAARTRLAEHGAAPEVLAEADAAIARMRTAAAER
jgi:hypothetical protein